MRLNDKHNLFKKEARLYQQLSQLRVQCKTCERQCIIADGKMGFCKTRKNERGVLYTINYGMVSSFSVNPIEKKPLFHYYPGSFAATVGSFSCNFTCPWCQNWEITKTCPSEVLKPIFLPPEEIVNRIKIDNRINGVSISFNEPTLSLEYAIDIFNLLNESYYKMFVTNGYMTTEALTQLIDAGLTGMSVTVKGNISSVKKYCQANGDLVWKTIEKAFRRGIHIEIICLIIPSVNDDVTFYKEVAEKILGINPMIPVHFTQFIPHYHFLDHSPTPVSSLERAYNIAIKKGLSYVYLGNVFGHPFENTYCTHCKKVLIKRTGYKIDFFLDLDTKLCPTCGERLFLKTN
ncbi:AmmeMemoRadiSam system radical SAM enzyme [Candidatus Hodarchaeum mangrovi]